MILGLIIGFFLGIAAATVGWWVILKALNGGD